MAPVPSIVLGPLPPATNIDEVLHNIDTILDWAIKTESKIGYFAVLYKRVTLGIRDAIVAKEFDDNARLEVLDVAFAKRYFDALNAYFHPGSYSGLTLPWEVAFVGDKNDDATMLQHMLAGLNAHITFDLAPATLVAAAGHPLDGLEDDFNKVNALLCSQIPGMLSKVEEVSPAVTWIRRLVPGEVLILQRMLSKLRSASWLSSIYMAMNPTKVTEKTVNQAAWTSAIGAWYLDPPAYVLGVFPKVVKLIAKREKTDVANNIKVVLDSAAAPAPMDARYLPGAFPSPNFVEKRRARKSSGKSDPGSKA